MGFGSVDDVENALRADSYLPDRGLPLAVFLALEMGRAFLREAGVGKTEVGKMLARILGSRLSRLQCYAGIGASEALFESARTGSRSAIPTSSPSRWPGSGRSPHRNVWLNPLQEDSQYEPLARGMEAALPYIDHFTSGHSFASLEELSATLARL